LTKLTAKSLIIKISKNP